MSKIFPMFMRYCSSATGSVKTPISVHGVEGRYVTALYSAAHQKQQLEDVEKFMQSLLTIVDKPKIKDFFENSLIPRVEKAKLLEDVASQAGMPETAKRFLGLVAENGRLKMIKKMIQMFLNVMVAHRNEALCEVITATPLDDASRQTLKTTLIKFVAAGKKITMTEKVDPSIIGGIILGIEDKHIDMSIARKVQMYTDLLKESI